MAKRTKMVRQERGFVLFDVVYADGTRASNRRVPAEVLGGLDGDGPALDVLAAQEQDIAAKAGRTPRVVETLTRSPNPSAKQPYAAKFGE